jgi:hypothetical protein
MGAQEAGVYWPFKSFLQGSGIVITETATAVTIGTTGAGPGGGDMLKSEFATNGVHGIVDHAVTADNISASGVVAHATLADHVTWAGITNAPTSFPADWSAITNKPSAFVPIIHGSTHISGGTDPIPLATLTASGLTGPLSGKVTDFRGGDGALHDLNTTVGSYLLTCTAGLSVTPGGPLTVNSGGIPGTYHGIIATGSAEAIWSFSTGTALNKDAVVLYKQPGNNYLIEQYNDLTGAGVWSGRLMNTYNPDGAYTMRAGTQLITSCNLSGNSTAWQNASLLINSSVNGGFAGIGFDSANYWACALGAWQSGLWIATSANTFVQLTDTSGHIPFTALESSGTISGSLTVSGTFEAVGTTYLGWSGAGTNVGGSMTIGANLQVNGQISASGALVQATGYRAQVLAYQDGNNYVRMLAGQGLLSQGNWTQGAGGGGQICCQGIGDLRSGIEFITADGWEIVIAAWGGGPNLYAICLNTGQIKQLLP